MCMYGMNRKANKNGVQEQEQKQHQVMQRFGEDRKGPRF